MKRECVALLYLVCAAAGALTVARPAVAAPPFTAADLGVLGTDPGGYGFSDAVGVNQAGQVAGQSLAFDSGGVASGYHAFLYTNGQMKDLGALGSGAFGSSFSLAKALNNNGQVAGYSDVYDASGNQIGSHAFLYANGQMKDLGTLGVNSLSGYSYSMANAVNDAGQVVGNSEVYGPAGPLGSHAFLYSGGQMKDLGTFGADPTGYAYSTATAINNAGQVVGFSDVYEAGGSLIGSHAFLYSGGQLKDLGTLVTDGVSYVYGYASALNDAGQVVGTSSVNGGGYHAFLYDNAQMKDLGALGTDPVSGYSYSYAAAVNNSGQAVGDSEAWDAQGKYLGRHAFLYSGGQMKDLGTLSTDLTGVGQSYATGINDAGQIVGYFFTYDANGNITGQHAFLYENGQMKDLNAVVGAVDLTFTAVQGLTPGGQIACSSTLPVGDSRAALLSPAAVAPPSDTKPPVIRCVSGDIFAWATSTAGAIVSFRTPKATDDVDGDVSVSCAPPSGSRFPLGTTTVTCTASDKAGNTATASFHVNVRYCWSGFLPPLERCGSHKAGSTIPVKFRLLCASEGIKNAAARLTYARITGGVPGPALPADASGDSNIGNAFRYDAKERLYIFNWSTKGLKPGTYRLAVDLGDGVDRHIDVTLK